MRTQSDVLYDDRDYFKILGPYGVLAVRYVLYGVLLWKILKVRLPLNVEDLKFVLATRSG